MLRSSKLNARTDARFGKCLYKNPCRTLTHPFYVCTQRVNVLWIDASIRVSRGAISSLLYLDRPYSAHKSLLLESVLRSRLGVACSLGTFRTERQRRYTVVNHRVQFYILLQSGLSSVFAKGIVELEKRIQTSNPVIISICSTAAPYNTRHSPQPIPRTRCAWRAYLFAHNPDFHSSGQSLLSADTINRDLNLLATVFRFYAKGNRRVGGKDQRPKGQRSRTDGCE